jgi:hypothetical protein
MHAKTKSAIRAARLNRAAIRKDDLRKIDDLVGIVVIFAVTFAVLAIN